MNANKSKIIGNRPRHKPIVWVSDVLIEWTNKIIIARPRKIAAMMVHAAIPFVDGKKSHEQDGRGSVDKQSLILQLLLAGNRLGKHVSCL